MTTRRFIPLALLALLPACARVGPLPRPVAITPDAVPVQYGKGGTFRTHVALTAEEMAAIRAAFAEAHAPEAERAAVARAVSLLETYVGERTPTRHDRHKNETSHTGTGQLDCVDESSNTTTYLCLLADDGLIRHHEVERPVWRAKFFIDAHRTAVLRDLATGERYAVDSWYGDNGAEPLVLPLNLWVTKHVPAPPSPPQSHP